MAKKLKERRKFGHHYYEKKSTKPTKREAEAVAKSWKKKNKGNLARVVKGKKKDGGTVYRIYVHEK